MAIAPGLVLNILVMFVFYLYQFSICCSIKHVRACGLVRKLWSTVHQQFITANIHIFTPSISGGQQWSIMRVQWSRWERWKGDSSSPPLLQKASWDLWDGKRPAYWGTWISWEKFSLCSCACLVFQIDQRRKPHSALYRDFTGNTTHVWRLHIWQGYSNLHWCIQSLFSQNSKKKKEDKFP